MTVKKKPFYFLRHGETNHNRYQIYDDTTEIGLNNIGIKQALSVQKIVDSLDISTVCSSPLLRAQQTKDIILSNKNYYLHVIIDELTECPSALWRLFLESEIRSLKIHELFFIETFVKRVERGLDKALQYQHPLLIVSHGGVFWALAHFLDLKMERKIGNCVLVKIFPNLDSSWSIDRIM